MIETKNKPTPNNKKIVIFLRIAIFLNEKVGILLINKNDIRTMKYGVIEVKSIKFEKPDN